MSSVVVDDSICLFLLSIREWQWTNAQFAHCGVQLYILVCNCPVPLCCRNRFGKRMRGAQHADIVSARYGLSVSLDLEMDGRINHASCQNYCISSWREISFRMALLHCYQPVDKSSGAQSIILSKARLDGWMEMRV